MDTTVRMFKKFALSVGNNTFDNRLQRYRPSYTKSILKILISLPIGFNSISLAIEHQQSYNRDNLPQINIPYVSRPAT